MFLPRFFGSDCAKELAVWFIQSMKSLQEINSIYCAHGTHGSELNVHESFSSLPLYSRAGYEFVLISWRLGAMGSDHIFPLKGRFSFPIIGS